MNNILIQSKYNNIFIFKDIKIIKFHSKKIDLLNNNINILQFNNKNLIIIKLILIIIYNKIIYKWNINFDFTNQYF